MRRLLVAIALTAVCGVASTTSATTFEACAFVCCNRPFTRTTVCTVNGLGTTCGTYLSMYGCP